MGTVIAATHLGLGRKVALKFMRSGVLDDREATGRFLREARAAAALRSEHVAQVMDVEIDQEDGTPYIVMEYLEGSDLGSILKTRGPPPAEQAVDYVLQACEALAEAHANGIVHRDLKPANLFLTHRPDGTPLVKVLDFGISKLNEAAQSDSFRLTHPRATVGSPQYMSPEQMIASPDVDPRADIWALGVMLYELLAGKPPFVAPTFIELCLLVTNRPHPPLGRRVPGLAPGLAAAVDRCLHKSASARFANLAALAEALAPHAAEGSEESAARIARTLGLSTAKKIAVPVAARRRRRGRLVALAIGGAAAVAVAAIGGALLVGRSRAMVNPERAAAAAPPVPAATPTAQVRHPIPAPALPPAAPVPTAPPAVPAPAPASRSPAATRSPAPRKRVPLYRREARGPAIPAAAPAASALASPTAAPAPPTAEATPPPPAAPPPPAPAPAPERPPARDGATPTRRGPVVTDL